MMFLEYQGKSNSIHQKEVGMGGNGELGFEQGNCVIKVMLSED